jgi:hypothetical protein
MGEVLHASAFLQAVPQKFCKLAIMFTDFPVKLFDGVNILTVGAEPRMVNFFGHSISPEAPTMVMVYVTSVEAELIGETKSAAVLSRLIALRS